MEKGRGLSALKTMVPGIVTQEEQTPAARLRKLSSSLSSMALQTYRLAQPGLALIWSGGVATARQAAAAARQKLARSGEADLPRVSFLAALLCGLVLAIALAGLVWRKSDRSVLEVAAVPAAPAAASGQGMETPAIAAPPRWIEQARAVTLFSLEAPELDKLPFQQRVRRSTGGGREETLTWGSVSSGPMLHLSLYRPGTEASPRSFFVDIAQRAAGFGIALRKMNEEALLAGKFGAFETTSVQLASGEAPRSCLAYRLIHATPAFEMTGWYCPAQERPVDRAALSCLIDRLNLMQAGDERALRQFFVEAERRRQGCGGGKAAGGRILRTLP